VLKNSPPLTFILDTLDEDISLTCPNQGHLTNLLTQALNSSFSSSLNETITKASTSHLILLHKGYTVEVTNYRPISLLDWKLLASILTNHLNKAIPYFLDPTNMASPHRKATEAIFNLYSTYDKMLQQSPQSALLSVDFKAFDSVTHQYLLALLQCIGFPPKFQNLLAAFFHGTARLYINGRLSSPFKVSQGVHQGDPHETSSS